MGYLKRGYQGVKITDYLLKTRQEVRDGETVELFRVVDSDGKISYKSQHEIDEENEEIDRFNEGKSEDDPNRKVKIKKSVEAVNTEDPTIKLGMDAEIKESDLIQLLDNLNNRGTDKGTSPSKTAEEAAKPNYAQWTEDYTIDNYLKDAENAIIDYLKSQKNDS